MIAGAVQQYLKAQGMAPVRVGLFGDYVAGAGPEWVVSDEPDGGTEVLSDAERYTTRLMVRTRADDMLAALDAGARAYDALRAMQGTVIAWTDPRGGSPVQYEVAVVRPLQRPTYVPSPTPGERSTTNYRLHVREV